MIVVGFVSVVAGVVMLLLFGTFSTRYAPRYSETGFEQIKVGDHVKSVRTVLGEPLNKWTNNPSFIVWGYTEPGRGGIDWKCRQIVLSNDVVIQKMSVVLD